MLPCASYLKLPCPSVAAEASPNTPKMNLTSDFSTLSVAAQVELLQRWLVPFPSNLANTPQLGGEVERLVECLSVTLTGIKLGLPSVE